MTIIMIFTTKILTFVTNFNIKMNDLSLISIERHYQNYEKWKIYNAIGFLTLTN